MQTTRSAQAGTRRPAWARAVTCLYELGLCFLAGTATLAPAQGLEQGRTTLTAGSSRNSLHYVGNRSGYVYEFRTPFPVFQLSSDWFTLAGGTGRAEGDRELGTPGSTLLDVRASIGGSPALFHHIERIPLAVRFPIRFAASYRAARYDSVDTIGLPAPSLVSVTMGLGIAGQLRLPVRRKGVEVSAGLVPAVGVFIDFADTTEAVPRLARSTDFETAVHLPRVVGAFGLVVTATWQSLRMGDATATSADLSRAIGNPTSIPKRRAQRVISLGVSW